MKVDKVFEDKTWAVNVSNFLIFGPCEHGVTVKGTPCVKINGFWHLADGTMTLHKHKEDAYQECIDLINYRIKYLNDLKISFEDSLRRLAVESENAGC